MNPDTVAPTGMLLLSPLTNSEVFDQAQLWDHLIANYVRDGRYEAYHSQHTVFLEAVEESRVLAHASSQRAFGHPDGLAGHMREKYGDLSCAGHTGNGIAVQSITQPVEVTAQAAVACNCTGACRPPEQGGVGRCSSVRLIPEDGASA